MSQNIRKALGQEQPYYDICREERNICAVFYHLLLQDGNIDRFLQAVGTTLVSDSRAEVYVEYSYLRDVWKAASDEEQKRHFLLDVLAYPANNELRDASFETFNSYFGATPKASLNFIQSPATWSMGRYDQNVEDDKTFMAISNLKWSFNAKPDIVIALPDDKAICIEAKFKSSEGRYPSLGNERTIFKRRGLSLVNQTETQKMIFDLLGIEAQFFYLVEKPRKNAEAHVLSWRQVFAAMDMNGVSPFVREWVSQFAS
ncbi:MAG: hypothetical protein Q7K29_09130 [Thermoleophilia bacterium]|nr:hypothetical protein [Thermoleophilia bacterium]